MSLAVTLIARGMLLSRVIRTPLIRLCREHVSHGPNSTLQVLCTHFIYNILQELLLIRRCKLFAGNDLGFQY